MRTHDYLPDRVRLLHPITGSYIGSFYPDTGMLEVQNKKLLATICLEEVKSEWLRSQAVTNDKADA